MSIRNLSVAIRIGLIGVACCGCDAKVTRFPNNQLYAVVVSKREALDEPAAIESVSATVDLWFGTPDQPIVPKAAKSLLSANEIIRAAGPVSSDRKGKHVGLYREHCATCHGIEGGGAGPAAAMLNPYPRDFRHGVFKFKSTGRADKPTVEDLLSLLHAGSPGTAMPSFATVAEEDRKALAQYVIYLSLRGETERRLIDQCATNEFSLEELHSEADAIVTTIVDSWLSAKDRVVDVPPAPSAQLGVDWWSNNELVLRGRELFHGPLANCASCHGQDGDGNATTLDFDDWTKEYTTKLGINPDDRAAMKPARSAGGLKPRQIRPRKLQWGVFHGDASDESLYRRFVVGIAGSPMPGLLLKDKPDGVGVSSDDVWAIVAYVKSLSHDAGKRSEIRSDSIP